tara:strand:+ start:224873 stop:225331 length:459 start_codon:yes stop_codon:yes gene_type:complete
MSGKGTRISEAVRVVMNAANGASIARFYPSMTDTDAPIARPVCAVHTGTGMIDVTIAIPQNCFKEPCLANLLNTIDAALCQTDAKLVDLNVPQRSLDYFDTTKENVQMLCHQLQSKKDYQTNHQNPWQKKSFIFDVIKGGKDSISGAVSTQQ